MQTFSTNRQPTPILPPAQPAPPPNTGFFYKHSTGSWVKSATKNNEHVADNQFLQLLVQKAKSKPNKVSKFYKALLKASISTKTIVAIKSLILLHGYVYYGPPAVLKGDDGALHILNIIDQSWHPSASRSTNDPHRTTYFCSLISKFSKVLRKKVVLHCQTHFAGNWTEGSISNTRELQQFIDYWQKLYHISEVCFGGVQELQNLRLQIAVSLAEEQIGLSELLYNQLVAMKVDEKYNELVGLYSKNFHMSSRVIETIKEARPSISIQSLDSLKVEFLKARMEKERAASRQQQMDTSGFDSNHSQKCAQPMSPYSPAAQAFPQTLLPKAADQQASPPQPLSATSSLDLIDIPETPSGSEIANLIEVKEEEKKSSLGIPLTQLQKLETSGLSVNYADLTLNKTLGVGSSCTVYIGTYRRTEVAIKVMHSNAVAGNNLKEFVREIEILMRMRHPNLVLFMGASCDDKLAVIMEYCKGDNLFKLLHESSHIDISWGQKLKMCKDVARGMHYLHNSGTPVLHRDLKSLNLLLADPVRGPNDPVNIKITDFGISRVLDTESLSQITGQMGTCHWMAPEVLSSNPYGLPADVYSFGIVLWEIAARRKPYEGTQPMMIPYKVLQCGDRPELSWIAPNCPPGLIELIQQCWATNPSERPNFDTILDALDAIEV